MQFLGSQRGLCPGLSAQLLQCTVGRTMLHSWACSCKTKWSCVYAAVEPALWPRSSLAFFKDLLPWFIPDKRVAIVQTPQVCNTTKLCSSENNAHYTEQHEQSSGRGICIRLLSACAWRFMPVLRQPDCAECACHWLHG